MKKRIKLIGIAVFAGCLLSCEDVIEVDLSEQEQRLVIDAVMRVDASETFTQVFVKVSLTSAFFSEPTPVVLDQITLIDIDGQGNPGPGTDVLNETEPGSGVYTRFVETEAFLRDTWLLQVNYQGQIYLAQSKFVPTVPIDGMVQGDGTIFDDTDTEVIVTFTDPGGRDDYYLFDFGFGNFLTTDDQFYQGQSFQFSYFYREQDVKPGDEIEVSILGVDQGFYSYMELIIDQSEEEFGVFETPSVTVRGNFINATDINNIDVTNNVNASNNFALGYFAIVQEFKKSLSISE